MYIKLTRQPDGAYGLPADGKPFNRLTKDHVTEDGIKYPRQILDRFTPEELLAVGIATYAQNDPAEGQRRTAVFNDVLDGNLVTRLWDCEDIPPQVDPEPGDPSYNYKMLRRRDYPDEGDMIDAICKALDGDRAEFDSLQAERAAVKARFPKE